MTNTSNPAAPAATVLTAASLLEASNLQSQIEAAKAKLEGIMTGEVASLNQEIANATDRLTAILGKSASRPTGTRVLSPEARAKIAEGQHKRWAAVKAAKAAAAAAPTATV